MKGKTLTRSVGFSILLEIRLQKNTKRRFSQYLLNTFTLKTHDSIVHNDFIQDISITKDTHHELGVVAILDGTARISIAIVLTVNNSAFHCLLDLLERGQNDQTVSYILMYSFRTPLNTNQNIGKIILENVVLASLRRMQCTMTIMKPSRESKTAKRIWKRAERRSVMARTADIQVRASRGRITQELHSDAPARSFSLTSVMPSLDTSLLKTRMPITMFTCSKEVKDTMSETIVVSNGFNYGYQYGQQWLEIGLTTICHKRMYGKAFINKYFYVFRNIFRYTGIYTRTTAAAGPTNEQRSPPSRESQQLQGTDRTRAIIT